MVCSCVDKTGSKLGPVTQPYLLSSRNPQVNAHLVYGLPFVLTGLVSVALKMKKIFSKQFAFNLTKEAKAVMFFSFILVWLSLHRTNF